MNRFFSDFFELFYDLFIGMMKFVFCKDIHTRFDGTESDRFDRFLFTIGKIITLLIIILMIILLVVFFFYSIANLKDDEVFLEACAQVIAFILYKGAIIIGYITIQGICTVQS